MESNSLQELGIAAVITLFTMVQGTDEGSPAKSAACRSGAWPIPAGMTFPM